MELILLQMSDRNIIKPFFSMAIEDVVCIDKSK